MRRLSGADIRRAFAALAEAMPQREKPVELWIVGGAVMVLQFELKAQYAFDDLWEADRGRA